MGTACTFFNFFSRLNPLFYMGFGFPLNFFLKKSSPRLGVSINTSVLVNRKAKKAFCKSNSMLQPYDKDFAKYREGLLTDQEKEAIWNSAESDAMLLEQWEQPEEMMADTPSFDKEAALNQLHSRIATNKLNFRRIVSVAAAVLIPFAIGMLWIFLLDKPEMLQMQTANAEIKEVVLPDGSKVMLNHASEISFPEKFYKTTREVELKGEAYFDVTHNPKQPFVVKMNGVSVQVLGTTFNCSAYENDKQLRISLISGKVEVTAQNEKMLLQPNEQAVWTKSNKQLNKTNIEANDVLAWKKGRLVFRETGLKEMANELSRRFNTKFSIADSLETHRITLTVKDESLEEVLELLKLTAPIDYAIDGKTVRIEKNE